MHHHHHHHHKLCAFVFLLLRPKKLGMDGMAGWQPCSTAHECSSWLVHVVDSHEGWTLHFLDLWTAPSATWYAKKTQNSCFKKKHFQGFQGHKKCMISAMDFLHVTMAMVGIFVAMAFRGYQLGQKGPRTPRRSQWKMTRQALATGLGREG